MSRGRWACLPCPAVVRPRRCRTWRRGWWWSLIGLVGLVLAFLIAFFLMTKIAPFSIRKEIEEDHNTAAAIVMGAILLGMSIIIAAAILG